MALTFHKMHGLGNDFVLLDLRQQDFPINKTVAKELADRHTGSGCDQVLILRESSNTRELATFEIWNADGSRAEQCGNGVRCLGLYLSKFSGAPAGRFKLGGPAGVIEVECLSGGNVRVEMGMPVFENQRVPVLLEPVDGWYSLDINQKNYRLGAVSMGNPHALMVVDDLDATDVARLGAVIGVHSAFPEGCNVGFAEIIDRDNIRLRVFERGAAETRACGSGACAAMAILHQADLVNESVNVTQVGGNLIINWTGGEKPVIMTGPAVYVFTGKVA